MTESSNFRRRRAARLLIISPSFCVLLFRFTYKEGPLIGSDYWATPGGQLEIAESYEMAAIRELREETGIKVSSVGLPVAEKEFLWKMSDGEIVMAVEKYFLVHVNEEIILQGEWTSNEIKVISDFRWWSEWDLKNTIETILPSDIIEILENINFKII